MTLFILFIYKWEVPHSSQWSLTLFIYKWDVSLIPLFEFNHLRKHGGLNYESHFDKLQKVTELVS